MHKIVRLLRAYSLLAAFCPLAHAQQLSLADLQAKMTGQWLVTIAGESRTRTLEVSSVAEKGGGSYQFGGLYSFTGEKLFSIKSPEIQHSATGTKLTFLTGSDSLIATVAQPDGTFAGTFTLKSGETKGVKLEKVSSVVAAAKPAAPAGTGSPVLGKGEVAGLITGKSLRLNMVRNGNEILWHLEPNGEMSARNMNSGNTDSGTWSITDRGSICVKLRSSGEGCSSVVRREGKIFLTNPRDQQPYADVVSIK